jgi:hypothetical protein
MMIRALTTISPRVAALRSYVSSECPDAIEDSFHLYQCHTIMNRTEARPKDLNPAERHALLGVSYEERWLHCLHDAGPLISPQELARVRAVIQIDETLERCVTDQHEMALWLRTLKMLAPFLGRTPLALLFRDMSGFKAAAEHLAAWQGT